jgi:hypothetical protein
MGPIEPGGAAACDEKEPKRSRFRHANPFFKNDLRDHTFGIFLANLGIYEVSRGKRKAYRKQHKNIPRTSVSDE